ncbi:CPBP family intramembrane glutamic endopeptidase [Rubrivirga sp. IMCC43871]|uniref:CPBP family intramembrane glutamic endopeptidase n=1 Tax=Rubrivirga sp. IMCC43871 TaxID=3391575 RepID=UPI00398FB6C6
MPSPADETARLAAESARLADEMEQLATPTPASDPAPGPVAPVTYLSATRSATYGFLAALPLFVLYEVGVILANGDSPAQVRVGADVWLKGLIASVGGTGWAAIGAFVVALGAVVMWRERARRPPLRAKWFGLIVAESLVYAVVLAFLVSGVVGAIFGSWVVPSLALAQLADFGLGLQLALSIGAGLYEELVFRVILVGGLFLLLRRVSPLADRRAYIVAAVVGALVFSAVHHIGAFGDPFTLSVFTFRFLFGLALNAVFLVRGFAVAAWTHALYDVLVVTGSL